MCQFIGDTRYFGFSGRSDGIGPACRFLASRQRPVMHSTSPNSDINPLRNSRTDVEPLPYYAAACGATGAAAGMTGATGTTAARDPTEGAAAARIAAEATYTELICCTAVETAFAAASAASTWYDGNCA